MTNFGSREAEMTGVLSQAEQDYLKAIYHLAGREATGSVGTSALAEWLGIAPPSATAMVKKLAERGFVARTPYHGVSLTPAGEKAALEVLRHHRLLETFLSRQLQVPWDQLHAEADKLEHALSEEMEDRLDAALGYPRTDPHGAPIPTKAGELPPRTVYPLWQATDGETVVVAEVEDEDAALLRYVADLGLVPGARVAVGAHGPFGGPLHIRIGEREFALGEAVARAVAVIHDTDTPDVTPGER